MNNERYQHQIQAKLAKGLLDMIILQFLDQEPMHGYQLITKIRRGFGVYFGPSTVYPLLGTLEKKGYVSSSWNLESERPKKVYSLTKDGETVLNFTERSLGMICQTISSDSRVRIEAAPGDYHDEGESRRKFPAFSSGSSVVP